MIQGIEVLILALTKIVTSPDAQSLTDTLSRSLAHFRLDVSLPGWQLCNARPAISSAHLLHNDLARPALAFIAKGANAPRLCSPRGRLASSQAARSRPAGWSHS